MDIQIIESESKGMSLAKENDNQVGSMTYYIAGT
jgi:hypothetical protein